MASTGSSVNLVNERKRRGLGIVEASHAIGISFNSLKLAEAGVEPRSDVARKIAAFYGLSIVEQWPAKDAA